MGKQTDKRLKKRIAKGWLSRLKAHNRAGLQERILGRRNSLMRSKLYTIRQFQNARDALSQMNHNK